MSSMTKTQSLWRHRDFMLLWSGQSVSLIGSQVTVLALPLLAVTVLNAPTFNVGLLSTCSTLPWLIVSLPAGVVVDRCRKRSVMLCCDLARAVILVSVPVASLFSALTLWQLYAVALLSGTFAVFFNSAYLSFPATLLEKEQLVDANGKISTASAIAGIAGPSLAGFLVGLIGAARAVTTDAFSYLASALTIFLVRHEEPAPERDRTVKRRFWPELLVGFRLIVASRSLVYITFANSFGGFVVVAINSIWVPYAVRGLGWSAKAVGLVMGISAVGGLVGSLLATRAIRRYGLPAVLLMAPIAFAPGELMAGLVGPGVWGQIVVTIGFGVTTGAVLLYNIAQRSYRLQSCPRDQVGRLNSTVNWLQWGLRPLAGILAGGLGTLVGLRLVILVFASLLALCAVALWASPLRGEFRSPAVA
ncbi:MAG TPA: MFS transporter [Pseudonocardiaceae bacterium]